MECHCGQVVKDRPKVPGSNPTCCFTGKVVFLPIHPRLKGSGELGILDVLAILQVQFNVPCMISTANYNKTSDIGNPWDII